MVMITAENRPYCIKEGCDNLALSYLDGMWVCGECLHKYTQKQKKRKQKAFLEG